MRLSCCWFVSSDARQHLAITVAVNVTVNVAVNAAVNVTVNVTVNVAIKVAAVQLGNDAQLAGLRVVQKAFEILLLTKSVAECFDFAAQITAEINVSVKKQKR